MVLYSVEMGLVLLAATVLIGPAIAERLRIPGLVGLIAIGMVLGPNVLEWLRPAGFVATVGVAGLLYLMFMAGLELDLRTFLANRVPAVTFGLLTFVVPFTLSLAAARGLLDLDWRAAALVGAMWASHTLVAYPEVKAAGLDGNRAVGVSVAATVITDVLALVVLAFAAAGGETADASAGAASTHAGEPPVPLWAGLVLMGVFCLVVLPRLTRWVFTHLFLTRTQRFVWLLGGMAAGATMGLLGGIEGLVGAFLAGIGMNRSVPARSELMERVEFVGSALLVPAFLVSIGLSIDPRALVEPATLLKAALFTGLVLVGKTIPALIAGRVFRYQAAEIALMATLTIGQAAATLAIARVGTATGIFDQEILNAAVVTVVASVLVTSFGTRFAARRIAQDVTATPALGDHIVALAPPAAEARTAARLLTSLRGRDNGLVTAFAVDVGEPSPSVPATDLAHFADALTHRGVDPNTVSRAGVSLAAATLTLAREVGASLVVVPVGSTRFPFGIAAADQLDAVGAHTSVPAMAIRLQPQEWSRVVVITGHRQDATAAADTALVADIVTRLAGANHADIVVLAATPGHATAFEHLTDATISPYRPRSGDALDQLAAGDLLILPAHVVGDAGLFARVRLQRSLRGVSVVVVGGPGRLRVSITGVNRSITGIGVRTTPAYAPASPPG